MKLICSSFLSLLFGGALISSASAQITTDGSTNTTLTPTDNGIRIDEGSRAGGNLFHSFGEFSVPTGSEAFFNNALDIVNIFSRVTGGNISNIDGLIRANGAANLFLINPRGIIFGEGARLDIGGSFYGSTADSILFPNGVEFSATNPQRPILTINRPIGLGLGDNPGDIVNNSVAEGVGLTVAPGENLALIGGNILLEGRIISASEGNIELGSIAGNSVVNLEPVNSSFELGYDEATNFSDITFTQGARIQTTEADINLRGDEISLNNGSQITSQVNGSLLGGDININARQLMISDQANIATATFAVADAGKINVDVSELIEIVGTGFEEFQQIFIIRPLNIDNPLDIQTLLNDGTGIFTATDGIGAAGNVTINTSSLQLREGAVVGSPSFAKGDGGGLTINTTDSIEIIGSGISNNLFLGSTGKGNILEIKTKNLRVTDGGIITTSTFGGGDGANIIINASEKIDILITSPEQLVTTGIFSSSLIGNGAAGDITIDTQRLNLQDGGQITSNSGIEINQGFILPLGGEVGEIKINASESIEISGGSPDNIFTSGIYSSTFTPNDAGDIDIVTDSLSVSNGGQISSLKFGEGNGGDITIINSDTISVDGENVDGFDSGIFNVLESTTEAESGGINITTGSLFLTNNAEISAQTNSEATAGTLEINANELVEVSGIGSGLFSRTGSTGDAGNINITTPELIIRDNAQIGVNNFIETDFQIETLTDNSGEPILDRSDNPLTTIRPVFNPREGSGNAGTLEITTSSLQLEDGGRIVAESAGGNGGDIQLEVDELIELLQKFFMI